MEIIMKKIAIVITLLLSACIKQSERYPVPQPIVEGYLSPGKGVSIKITQEIVAGAMDTLVPLEVLSVTIEQNHQPYTLTYTGKGIYANTNMFIKEGDSCSLHFEYNGKTVSAHTHIPDRPNEFICSSQTIKFRPWRNEVAPELLMFNWGNT